MKKNNTFILLIIALTINVCSCLFADPPVEPEYIQKLAEDSSKIYDCFLKKTITTRTAYSLWGDYLNDTDRELVRKISEETAAKLKPIAQAQETARRRIERYEGEDWDNLYGETGLWRKSRLNTMQSTQRRITALLHQATAIQNTQRENLLYSIESEISSSSTIDETFKKFALAKTDWLKDKKNDRKLTIERLDFILKNTELQSRAYFQTALLKFEIAKNTKPEDIYRIAAELENTPLANDTELSFALSMHEIKAGKRTLLDKLAQTDPAINRSAGTVFLQSALLNGGKNLNLPQAELTAVAALTETGTDLCGLFENFITVQKYRTPVIYFAAGQTCSQKYPAKASNYYLRSVSLSGTAENICYGIPITEAARRAALLAYQACYSDPAKIPLALKAMQTCIDLAGDDADKQIEYFYASLLLESGQNQKAEAIFKKITQENSKFAADAQLELIFSQAASITDDPAQYQDILNRLTIFIDSCEDNGKIKTRAAELHCKLLLEQNTPSSAEKVLDIIETQLDTQSFNARLLKAAALTQIGRLGQAIPLLTELTKDGNCKAARTAGITVCKVLEKIDEFEAKTPDYEKFIGQCRHLISSSLGCSNSEALVNYYTPVMIEISIIAAGKNITQLAAIEYFLDKQIEAQKGDIIWLRCKARLLMGQQRYDEAFKLWSRIADILKPAEITKKHPDSWWRAKYYALEARSKTKNTDTKDVTRAIDILLSSTEKIPDFWKNKLIELKKSQ